MRSTPLTFPGWPGGARAIAPEAFARRDAEVERQFDFLLRAFTPRTVFMEIGSADGELCVRAASYVERVWCVDAACRVSRPPCNLRVAPFAAVPAKSVDVVFSGSVKDPEAIHRLLSPHGVYFVHGQLLPAQLFREAGFSKVHYFAGNMRVPGALARISRSTTTAVFK
jgi:hypothetical protein